ncbi:MAG: hypothetical protein JSW66_08555 [Phycisphaerales bacterium]|nr:MAG: hypothetical protein JSW66_08555 [Phycisphaerales bacterium]
MIVVESVYSGPVAWLTGCIHGDEVTGIVLGHSDFSVAFPGAPVMAFGGF